MPHLIWTRLAGEDLQRLREFLLSKDAGASRRAIAAIRAGVLLLKTHPDAGTHALNKPLGYCEWPIRFSQSGYIALYRVEDGQVHILAVKHPSEENYSYRF